MLRTKALFASALSLILMRSPRTAPPEYGLLGSMAMTATLLPADVNARISAEISVDLPPPGTPVMPTICARPACR
jgi:hypothetical protein